MLFDNACLPYFLWRGTFGEERTLAKNDCTPTLFFPWPNLLHCLNVRESEGCGLKGTREKKDGAPFRLTSDNFSG